MLTEFVITIVTAQDSEIAEQDIRKAIMAAGYGISEFGVEIIEEDE